MMGTGEASGDRRAIQAAEAAIANPLLDETSMRGAKGLLISITGGKDLTLFEVDEAATRIREEVDPDANIILGATFEESLEGVIRVSVVATGIDNEVREDSTPAEIRMAELSQRLRTATRPEDKPAVRPAAATAPRVVAQAPHPQVVATAEAEPEEHYEEAAPAPVAQAPAPKPVAQARPVQAEPQAARDADVTITPYKPVAADYDDDFDVEMELRAAFEQDHAVNTEEPFIPPQAETAPQVRMPRVEDFPPIAQRQIEAHQGGGQQAEEDRGPMSLLRRLAHVGLGRREEEAPRVQTQPKQRPAQQQAPQTRPKLAPPPPQQRAAAQQVAAPPPPPSEYAKRPPAPRTAQQDAMYRPRQAELDKHGRPLPRDARQIDDELEIPAFLRRQAN
ncbi:MAG: cell division protein FtsZ, partial [Bauldia sp.]|nr:cell division protein FtsZ [Bauldia sp.]